MDLTVPRVGVIPPCAANVVAKRETPCCVTPSMNHPFPRTSLAIVFTIVCIDLLGFGLVLPLLPIYGEQLMTGYSKEQLGLTLGLLQSSFTIMQFVFAPIWGRISDRIGRRPVLLVGLAGSVVFYGLFGLATHWHSLGGMFLSRIGAGIAGATIPTAQAYIADVTTREHRTQGMALIGAAFGLGFTLGPLLGALAIWISGDTGMSPWPGYVASGLSAMALTLAMLYLPEPIRPEAIDTTRHRLDWTALREALGVPSIGLLLGTGFFAVFSLANLESTLSLAIKSKLDLSHGRDESQMLQLFLVFAYVGLIQSLVQGGLLRPLASRCSEGALATTGFLLSIAGFLLMATVMAQPQCGLGSLMLAVAVEVSGIAFIYPSVQSLVSRRSDPTEQGGILGVAESVNSVARITGAVFGVVLYQAAAATWPYWSAAALMCLALLSLTAAVRRGKDWPLAVEAEL